MTRLLLDENFPGSTVARFVQAGHDVQTMAALGPGLPDLDVLRLAREQDRCLITFDADFGELVFQQQAEPPPSIVYVRMHPIDPDAACALALHALEGPLSGMFIVATIRGLRRRRFSTSAGDASA